MVDDWNPEENPLCQLGVLLITKDYFKKHNLLSSLFDNPPADRDSEIGRSCEVQP